MNIKVRFHDFTTIIRSKSLPEATNQTEKIWQVARVLFNSAIKESPFRQPAVRLLGVGVSGFSNDHVAQGDLFSNDEKYDVLDEVTDEINHRFGKLKIHRGRNTK